MVSCGFPDEPEFVCSVCISSWKKLKVWWQASWGHWGGLLGNPMPVSAECQPADTRETLEPRPVSAECQPVDARETLEPMPEGLPAPCCQVSVLLVHLWGAWGETWDGGSGAEVPAAHVGDLGQSSGLLALAELGLGWRRHWDMRGRIAVSSCPPRHPAFQINSESF